MAKAFDLFFSGRPGGTGMGLAMVRRIVDKHGGTVELTSRESQGTTVTMRFHGAAAGRRDPQSAGASAAQPEAPPTPGLLPGRCP